MIVACEYRWMLDFYFFFISTMMTGYSNSHICICPPLIINTRWLIEVQFMQRDHHISSRVNDVQMYFLY